MGSKNCKIQKPLLGKLDDTEAEKFKIYDRENKRPLPFCCCFIPQTKSILSISNLIYQVNVSLGFITVTMIQTYENNLQEHTDLEYVFSTRINAAFIKLEVEFGDKKLIGLIKEKQIAQQEYLDGIQQGKTMVYSDQVDEFPDIMRFKLGNLAPKSRLIVNYQYIQPLEVCVNEFWKIELEQNLTTQRHLNPYSNSFKQNFKQDISITFDLPTPITFCQSPTHKIIRKEIGKLHDKDQIQLDPFYQENFQADKRFILLFSNFQIHQPTVSLSCTDRDELKQEQYCATISFIPKFNPQELDDAYQAYLDQQDLNAQEFQYQQKGEYIFLLDRSCSLSGGNRIQKAKEAICLFIRSLPQDSYFNVVSFGTNYEKIWTESQKYSKDSATEALQKVELMQADLGGTEILTPLYKDIYKQERREGYTLNIFILTDGEVSPDPIIDLVKQKSKPDIKVYCLGIGEGCSKFLVEKVSWVGNGKFHFICDNEDLNSKVIDLLQDSITPQLENFELEHNLKNPYCIIPNPQSVKCLKKNKQFTIQILFPKQDINQLIFVIKWYDPQIKQQCSYDINVLQSFATKQEQFHKLAAYKLIQILEDAYLYDEENVGNLLISKESISLADLVGISVTHQVLSRATAFICEVSEPDDNLKEKLKQKVLVKQEQSGQLEKKSLNRKGLKKAQINKSKQSIRKQEKNLDCLQQMSCQMDTFKCLDEDKPELHHIQDYKYNFRIADTKVNDIGDQEQVQNEFHDDKSPTDINVPAFVKKRSEQRYQKEQEERNLEKQQKQDLRKQEEQVQDVEINKLNIEQDMQQINQKNVEISTLEILKYAEIDGQFDIQIYKLFNFKELTIPEGLNEQQWINIVVINYLELKCQKDKIIWQLIVKKTIEHLTKSNLKHQAYKEQVLELIKELR